MREYAVYKGEEFITIGTADECAKELGVKSETIRWLSTPTAQKRQGENSIVVVKMEDEI